MIIFARVRHVIFCWNLCKTETNQATVHTSYGLVSLQLQTKIRGK